MDTGLLSARRCAIDRLGRTLGAKRTDPPISPTFAVVQNWAATSNRRSVGECGQPARGCRPAQWELPGEGMAMAVTFLWVDCPVTY